MCWPSVQKKEIQGTKDIFPLSAVRSSDNISTCCIINNLQLWSFFLYEETNAMWPLRPAPLGGKEEPTLCLWICAWTQLNFPHVTVLLDCLATNRPEKKSDSIFVSLRASAAAICLKTGKNKLQSFVVFRQFVLIYIVFCTNTKKHQLVYGEVEYL